MSRPFNGPPQEDVLISILLPVSVNALCAALRGLQSMEGYNSGATFMRQVGCHMQIYEMDPPPASYLMRGDGAGI